MPEIKADKKNNSLIIEGSPDVSDYPLLSEIFGDIDYDIRLQAAEDLSKAIEGSPDVPPAEDIDLLANLRRSFSFESELSSLQIDEDALQLSMKKLPVGLIYEDDRLIATTHSRKLTDGVTEEINKRFKIDWEIAADTEDLERSSGSFGLQSGRLKTEYNISSDRHKIIFNFQDPDSHISGKLICDKKEGKDPGVSVFLQKSERTIFLSFNPEENLLVAEGGLRMSDKSSLGMGAEITESGLSEAFRISYEDEGRGSINFELKFNQSEEAESGFEASLNIDLSHF